MKLGKGKKPNKDEQPATSAIDSVEAVKLRELCGVDMELYSVMSRMMFLDPARITVPLDRVVSDAQTYENQGEKLRAEIAYRIAGGVSLYKGDLAGVQKYFSKAASIAGDTHPEYQIIVHRAQSAVEVARKFYEESGSPASLSKP